MKKPLVSLVTLVSLAVLIIAGFVGHASLKEARRGKKIKEMVLSLEEQKKNVERENMELREKIAYLETDGFHEKTAKDKLNMQNQGEKVVVIKQSATQEKQQQQQPDQQKEQQREISNPHKWLNYFFSY